MKLATNPNPPTPSAFWYIGHLFLGIITGLVCYLIWHEKNPSAAKKHLIVSIILMFVPAIIGWLILSAVFVGTLGRW